MSQFTETEFHVTFLEGGRLAILLAPIQYELGYKGSGNWLIIPSGFKTDGGTVPRFLWWFMPPWGSRESKAAVVHDKLLERYRMGFIERKDADDEFYIALIALGVPKWKAYVVWMGVRLLAKVKGS